MTPLCKPNNSFRLILIVKWTNFSNTDWNFAKCSGLLPNDSITMVTEFCENRLRNTREANLYFEQVSLHVGQIVTLDYTMHL